MRIQHWQDVASLLLGVWLILSPFALGFAGDLTGLFWTKLCEKLSLERSFGHAEEEV
jgi:SPW repeat